MIFVTVGSDTPFDRLVKVVDAWAAETGRNNIFAQIGAGAWEPKSIPFANMLTPCEFKEQFMAARIIIGHAGMGTIISALHYGKPILVMPRRGHLGETRNDHQMATARKLLVMGKVSVALDVAELLECLNRLEELTPKEQISAFASEELVEALRGFIHGT